MTDEQGVNNPQPSRRRVLSMVSGLTALGVSSVVTSNSVGAAPGDQQWAFGTYGDVGSPTVVDGTVFVGGGNKLYAVDTETGTEEWAFDTGNLPSSPTVVDGTVFVGSGDNLYAMDAGTGQKEWVFDIGGDVGSPTVADGTVFVGRRFSLYAVDAETGSKKWAFDTGGDVGPPIVVDETVFVGSDDNNLYAVDAETGQEQWAFDTRGTVGSPTVADGTVFVGSDYYNLYAVDAKTGTEEWAFNTGGTVGSPTVADGTVFVDGGGGLYAVDAETGTEEWTDNSLSSPTVVDGTVFVNGGDDNLYAVDAETGSEKWAFDTYHPAGSSIVVDGTVFVGTDDNNSGFLYAVDAGVSGSSEGSRARLGADGHHNDWQHANQSISIPWHALHYSRLRNNAALIIAGAGVVGIGGYGIQQQYRSTDSTDSTTEDEPSDTTTDPDTHSEDDADTGVSTADSDTEDGTATANELQEQAIEAIDRAERAAEDSDYEMAVESYEAALTHLEGAAAEAADSDVEKELAAILEETEAALDSVTTRQEHRDSIATTLQAAERSFKEGIARYSADEQTVARIRFRQARDAFGEAQQTIDDSDAEVLAQPIEVSFEQEATLASMALEDLAVLVESTVETLAAVDIDSITDLESDPENEAITPAVVNDLEESDELSSEETALLTILSWWYEGASREFTSKTVILRRYEQADYGFDQSR